MTSKNLSGRAAFNDWKNKTYPEWLKTRSDQWETLPANIRLAVCRYASVPNERLDKLTDADRNKLLNACQRLQNQLQAAHAILATSVLK